MKLLGEPRWLLADGPIGLGNCAALGLVLAVVAWLLSPLSGVLSALARTPGLALVGALHTIVVLVFPPVWLLDWFATPSVLFRIENDRGEYALTIDDGLDDATTPGLLDVLARHDARATFFVLGESLASHPKIAARVLAEGHELANHQMTDRPSIALPTDVLETEMRACDALLEPLGGARWFRPGGGFVTETTEGVCENLGLTTALGSVFPFDSHLKSFRFIAAFVVSRTEAGSIVILHDGTDRGSRAAEVLDRVLPQLAKRGLRAETLTAATRR